MQFEARVLCMLLLSACSPTTPVASRAASVPTSAPAVGDESDSSPEANLAEKRIEPAPPTPELGRIVATFEKAAKPGESATDVGLGEAECRALTGFDKPNFDRCRLSLHANGTAAAVNVSYDCGDHTCSAESFVWYGPEREPHRIQAPDPIEVSPDHHDLLVTEISYREEFPPILRGGRTLRVDRRTGDTRVFLDCFSAKLSPGGRYYVCRDIDANVLRVRATGGSPEIVVRAELPEDTTVKLGGPFDDYPAPVVFVGPHELEYELFINETGEVLERRAPWRE